MRLAAFEELRDLLPQHEERCEHRAGAPLVLRPGRPVQLLRVGEQPGGLIPPFLLDQGQKKREANFTHL